MSRPFRPCLRACENAPQALPRVCSCPENRAKALPQGYGMCGIAFARPKAFFGDGPVSFRRKTASLRSVLALFRKPRSAIFGDMRRHPACMADPNRPRKTRGRGKPVTTEIRIPAAFRASSAPAVRFGRKRKRLLPPASTRYAIRPAAEGGLGYAGFWGWGKSKRISSVKFPVFSEVDQKGISYFNLKAD
jgi:hypothetical protein